MLSLREANHHSDSCRLQNMASDALCVYNPLEKNNVFLGSNILLVRVLYWGHKSNLLRKKRSVSTTTKKFSLGANGNQSVTKSRPPPPQSYFWNMFVSSCFLFFPMLIPIKSISGGVSLCIGCCGLILDRKQERKQPIFEFSHEIDLW